MKDDLKERIAEYMAKCRLCTIATAGADGQPNAATIFFTNAGTDIYFNTASESQKVRNIRANPRVAIAMTEPGPVPATDRDIKGIQCFGRATVVADAELSGVPKGIMARHKAFNSATPGKSVVIKVTPQKIYLVDYARGFRHRDLLEL